MVSLWVSICGKCRKLAPQAIAFEPMVHRNSPSELPRYHNLGSLCGTMHGPWTCARLETTSLESGQGPGRRYHYGLHFVENAASWPPKQSPLSQWATGIHPRSLLRYHISGSQLGTVEGPWTCAHLETTSRGLGQGCGKWHRNGLLFAETATGWPPKQLPLSQWATGFTLGVCAGTTICRLYLGHCMDHGNVPILRPPLEGLGRGLASGIIMGYTLWKMPQVGGPSNHL